MSDKKYASLNTLQIFLSNLKNTFAKQKHTHTKSEIIDMPYVPFSFGVDENGNYGYIKVGADSVTPFKTVSKKVGTIVCGLSERTLDLSSLEDRDRINVDNFYLIPTSFKIIDSPVTGELTGEITFGEYIIRKTYSNYIFRCRRDSIPGNVAVDLQCDVYIIY